MQLTRLVAFLAAAAGSSSSSSSGALAFSAAGDIAHEIRGLDLDLGVGSAGLPLVVPRQTGSNKNLQTFTGALGGIKADAVLQTGDQTRPFTVDGSTFTDFASAAGRSCDNQKNNCAQSANSGNSPGFTVSDCDAQNTQCKANINAAAAAQSSQSVSTSTSTTSSISTSTTSTSTSLSTSSTSTSTPVASSVASTTTSATLALVSQNAEFNFFCEV